VIIAYALAYLGVWVDPHTGNRMVDLGNSLYFSAITFSTVGYGDFHPTNTIGKVLAASEGLLGIFFTGLFLVTFVKKFAR
jgi:hypothetical protein